MARLVLHVAQVSSLVKMNGDNTFCPVFVKVKEVVRSVGVSDGVVAFVYILINLRCVCSCFCNANSIESRYLYVSVLNRGIINFLALVLFNFVSQNLYLPLPCFVFIIIIACLFCFVLSKLRERSIRMENCL
jgi:hypothetical protein